MDIGVRNKATRFWGRFFHGPTVFFEGFEIPVPKFPRHGSPQLTREQRIEAISESTWARGWAESMLATFGERPVEEARVREMARRLAETVVGVV